ncbi:VCBS repeat-containing protein [Microvirga rosea]|nr:VCBS repeat-containing protein [Microvirga rosea]
MAFFSTSVIQSIKSNPERFHSLYEATRNSFKAYLGSKFGALPEDYIKLIFSAQFAYESAPYGPSSSRTLEGLLQEKELMCSNYCDLSWLLYEELSPSSASSVVHLGWNSSPVGGHAELLISKPGSQTLMVDPTVMGLVLNNGINHLTSGIGISKEDQLFLGWRTNALTPSGSEVEEFASSVQDAYTHGNFRAGHLFYWYEYSDRDQIYGGTSARLPTPQAEVATYGVTNNKSLIPFHDTFKFHAGGYSDAFTGSASSDQIIGSSGDDIIFGGTSRAEETLIPGLIERARSGAFVSVDDLAAAKADPNVILSVYVKYKTQFKAFLGSAFSQLPESYIRLAFASTLVHDMKRSGTTKAYTFGEALASDDLDAPSMTGLAWNFFKLMIPGQNYAVGYKGPDVSMVGWYGEATGLDVQLMISDVGKKSLIVDPTLGHVAIISDFNTFAAGESVAGSSLKSTYWRGDLDTERSKVLSALAEGNFRTGNMLFWFETPDDIKKYVQGVHHWATPQGEAYLFGKQPSSAIGKVQAVDKIYGGAGADLLAGDGFTNKPINWSTPKGGAWSLKAGDFDGDGREDLIRTQTGSPAEVFHSTGSKFVGQGNWTLSGPRDTAWYVGDFNGDGKDDVLRYLPSRGGHYGAEVALSDGTKFGAPTMWSADGLAHHNQWYVGDFNGDGKDDLLRGNRDSGPEVLLSNGSGFGTPTVWTGSKSATSWKVGDFNGDGKTDIARYSQSTHKTEALLSNGSSFDFAGVWSTHAPGKTGWLVADVNGDGRDDLVGSSDDIQGVSTVLLSSGNHFSPTKSFAPFDLSSLITPGDYNGDGRDDFVVTDKQTKVSGTYLGVGTRNKDKDYFIMEAGQANGDTILDFTGSGANGDVLVLQGYGEKSNISISNSGDTWTVANASMKISDTFRVLGVHGFGSDDILFA